MATAMSCLQTRHMQLSALSSWNVKTDLRVHATKLKLQQPPGRDFIGLVGAVRVNRGLRSCRSMRIRSKASDLSEKPPVVPGTPPSSLDPANSETAYKTKYSDGDDCLVEDIPPAEKKKESSDLKTLWRRFLEVAAPYWSSEDKFQARLRLLAVFVFTLGTTGISVTYNFLGRDFYNALASKDQEVFTRQLLYYLAAIAGGIPVFVLRDYSRDTLALRWRAWMTNHYMERYFKNRTFYSIQSQSLIDNPDQRLVDDLNAFTGTALAFSLGLFNAAIDLVSFSGILYGIYPPLFAVLIVYSIGGTAISVALGKNLVDLNFMQEKREADFRYGLVRVRENAESVAFYGGEKSEIELLLQRFKQSFENYSRLLVTGRNLDFFTSGYRYLIQLLPAAVVAPLYFSGSIEFGVINQSFSAFNHVLSDFSIVVYQFQSLSSFSAVVDRLGEFNDLLDSFSRSSDNKKPDSQSEEGMSTEDDKKVDSELKPKISLTRRPIVVAGNPNPNLSTNGGAKETNDGYFSTRLEGKYRPSLLEIEDLTVYTPQYSAILVRNLSLRVSQGDHLLIMGASGTGKTSLLRAIAGLWSAGTGSITCNVKAPGDSIDSSGAETSTSVVSSDTDHFFENVFFLPQRPYMVLGTLRQQLLYPVWNERKEGKIGFEDVKGFPVIKLPEIQDSQSSNLPSPTPSPPSTDESTAPNDDTLRSALSRVRLAHLLKRCDGLDSLVDWSSVLSLGEQQRLAFARLLLTNPKLALMDESTSALDEDNEAHLYREIEKEGITYISVGHRSSLRKFHTHVLNLNANESEGWSVTHLDK